MEAASVTDPALKVLREAVEQYRRLVELSPDAIFVIQDGYHVFANRRGIELLGGTTLADLQRQPAIDFMPPEDHAIARERLASLIAGQSLNYVEERLVRLDGRIVHIEAAGTPITYGGRPAALVVVRDISDRKATEEALRQARERFAAAFAHAPVGMAILDDGGRVHELNPAMSAMLGLPPSDLVGKNVSDIVHPDDLPRALDGFAAVLSREAEVATGEVRIRRADGGTRWVLASASRAGDGDATDEPSLILHVVDITVNKDAEERLSHQALHDALTGLPNRALFLDRLEHALATLPREDGTLALFFLDLDGFKTVNDTLGHARGDDLLVEIARRLHATVRASDTLARFGGDEFALLVHDPGASDVEELAELAERIGAAVRPPVRLAGQEVSVNASIGIAATRGDVSGGELLRRADVAMYEAKKRAVGWRVYRA